MFQDAKLPEQGWQILFDKILVNTYCGLGAMPNRSHLIANLIKNETTNTI